MRKIKLNDNTELHYDKNGFALSKDGYWIVKYRADRELLFLQFDSNYNRNPYTLKKQDARSIVPSHLSQWGKKIYKIGKKEFGIFDQDMYKDLPKGGNKLN